LGRQTAPEMSEYSAVAAVHTLWLTGRLSFSFKGLSLIRPVDAPVSRACCTVARFENGGEAALYPATPAAPALLPDQAAYGSRK
jgi:hypothetical protein